MKSNKYSTIVFDCDGVILNSNKIKTDAFFNATIKYGEKKAYEFVNYHIKNGGISRYKKFDFFITKILNKDFDKILYSELLENFSEYIIKKLMICEVVEGLDELKDFFCNTNWLIVSGGNQSELRSTFKNRLLDIYFTEGIYGSPDSKEEILTREIKNQNITFPALYVGDSKYDYEVASKHGLDFIFISQWTEVKNFKKWCDSNNIKHKQDLKSILN
jgi:phosphoglycolate phosphatase-like HAD superfamily hydrolase